MSFSLRNKMADSVHVYHARKIHVEPPYDLLKTDRGIQLAPEICLRIAEEIIKSNPKLVAGLMGLSKV
jgi:hypothetical protein